MTNAIGGWKWVDEVYQTNVILLVCERTDIEANVRTVVREPNIADALMVEVGDPSTAQEAFVVRGIYDGFACALIWLQPTATAAIAAHEAFHVTAFVLGRAGMILSRESEEAYAYFLEWLMRGVEACVNGSTPPAEALSNAAE